MYYLGIDYHKKFSQVAAMDESGRTFMNVKMPNDVSAFLSLKDKLGDVKLKAVVEACRDWGTIYDLLESVGIETVVAHPVKTRAIAEAKIKTDSIDASTLAHLLRTDLIPKIYIPNKKIRAQKNLLRHRLWLVKQVTRTKNRIHNILDRNYIKITAITTVFRPTGRRIMDKLVLPDIDSKLLKDHLQLLDTLEEHISRTETWIDQELDSYPEISILDSIPGFGKIFAALATLEIADINRFCTQAKFASYCCLIPSTYASGGKVFHGNLIPTGNKWLKYLFIDAAWSSIKSSPYCRQYFNKIKERKGWSTAIVALARRLSNIAFLCLKEKRVYEERVCASYSF
jgi:transposase